MLCMYGIRKVQSICNVCFDILFPKVFVDVPQNSFNIYKYYLCILTDGQETECWVSFCHFGLSIKVQSLNRSLYHVFDPN